MNQLNQAVMSRVDARIPLAVRDLIDRAAAMQGRTRTDFLVEAAMEKAEKVIAEQAIIRFTLQDQAMLTKALLEETVTAPTPFIRDLAAEFIERVKPV